MKLLYIYHQFGPLLLLCSLNFKISLATNSPTAYVKSSQIIIILEKT